MKCFKIIVFTSKIPANIRLLIGLVGPAQKLLTPIMQCHIQIQLN